MLLYNEVEEEHEILCLQGTRVCRIEMGSVGTEIHVRWEIKKRVFSDEINTHSPKMMHMCVVLGQRMSYDVTLRQ
jgi:hypothetical protein